MGVGAPRFAPSPEEKIIFSLPGGKMPFANHHAGVGPRETMKSEIEDAYARHRESLRAFFHDRTRRRDFADDLIQEVYLELRERPPAETLRDPALYLYKVAWNVLRRAHRAVRRGLEIHDPAELERLGERTTDDAGAELAAEEYLMHLLGQLPPMYGAVLVLRLRDGLTYRQIAERLGVTVRSVKRHMEIVLAHLRRAQW
jgi:RNA polymerase sigma-70 factor (ECF subfamily)